MRHTGQVVALVYLWHPSINIDLWHNFSQYRATGTNVDTKLEGALSGDARR
ncbi:MAG: hypothetical protein K0S00_4852 [Xanthobacteraceae bacterium]|nr:hypothetical protein [Xanthobacteraceae bacterium]